MILLQRRLNGANEIVDVVDSVEHDAGVMKFDDFLKEVGLRSNEGLLELAQVLKVPIEEMVVLNEGGSIEGVAQENIRHYLRNCRVPDNALEFLQSQSGGAGTKNKAESDHSDFKDNCGYDWFSHLNTPSTKRCIFYLK